ncbi:MAG TPA: tRNA guanosine(34) transglycosylase Tgt [Candidatus Eremiobacteraceae bacterium]|nr:tRNA guanosine(34) transglycosylase Tgt [Candidatus Eremiobacteraceae bacterium]
MSAVSFSLEATDGLARAGTFRTRHGDVASPAFMPVGTQASVKGLSPDELRVAGATMILANAYHCYLRPGASIIAKAGGLHGFMSWDRPILTDSGGFQIFSLSRLSKVDDEGYHFASHLDGSRHTFTPESVVALQEALGSDVAMALDDLAPGGVDESAAADAAERTLRWAERTLAAKTDESQATFAIVQGSTFEKLRRDNARALVALDFPGYAIGGLWVGEPKADGLRAAAIVCKELPAGKPRYLMGVGTPEDMLAAIAVGVDLFDCVYPTRCARHALALTSSGRLNLRNARHADDLSPLDGHCGCAACTQFTRAYLAHLFRAGEALGPRMVSVHNIAFMTRLARDARRAVIEKRFARWRAERKRDLTPEDKRAAY